MPNKQAILIAFIAAVGANLTAAVFNISWLEWTSKPLLMPLLLIYFGMGTPERRGFHRYIGLGLIFSTAGDVLLLFGAEELFFMLGLGSFGCLTNLVDNALGC